MLTIKDLKRWGISREKQSRQINMCVSVCVRARVCVCVCYDIKSKTVSILIYDLKTVFQRVLNYVCVYTPAVRWTGRTASPSRACVYQ